MALQITTENYSQEVEESTVPVLLDFWAEWCPPCKVISPIIDKLSTEYEGKVKIAKVDVDVAGEIAQKFNVSSIPTLVLLNKGEIVSQQVGAIPEPAIVDMFKDFI